MESWWERDLQVHKGWDLCLCGGAVGGGACRSGGGGESVVHMIVGGGLCRSG